jgi:hypothetical protein
MLQDRNQTEYAEAHNIQASLPRTGHTLTFHGRDPNQLVLVTSKGTQHVITTPVASAIRNLWEEAHKSGSRYLCRGLIERVAGMSVCPTESSDIVRGPYDPIGSDLREPGSITRLSPMSVIQIFGSYTTLGRDEADRGVIHYALVLAVDDETVWVLEKQGAGPLMIATLADSINRYSAELTGAEYQLYVCSLDEFRGGVSDSQMLEW